MLPVVNKLKATDPYLVLTDPDPYPGDPKTLKDPDPYLVLTNLDTYPGDPKLVLINPYPIAYFSFFPY